MTEIISHPGKSLIKHLKEVAKFCALTIANKQFAIAIDTSILSDLGFIQGAVHEIGKATQNFQTYIRSRGKEVIQTKYHALISAYLAKQIAAKYLETTKLSEFDKSLLPYFIFTSVKRHHGNVLNFDDELETVRKKEEDLIILIDNFYDAEVQIILNELLVEINIQYDWEDFKSYMHSLEDVFLEFDEFSMIKFPDDFEELPNLKKAEYFYLHQLFFSALLFSDKTDVKLDNNKIERNSNFNSGAIENFRSIKNFNNPSEKINQLKSQAYFEGLESLRQTFNPNQHLYSITLPTGLGKTITSLAIAMKMKKILTEQNPRIIITIPFTSIIDQNYDVFNEIFNSPNSDILLKHHHLTEPRYKIDEDTVKDDDVEKGQFLIETWQSEIVVTTFV
ncbi:MAG: CRISPR-associated endonuclease/helicase Cas3 [Saprospiraceae bacterium]